MTGRRRFALALAALFFSFRPGLEAQTEDPNLDKPEYGVPHPECTLFTEKRDRYLRADLEGRYANGGTSFSALTAEVVGALPPAQTPPTRSRSGALRETRFDNYIDTHIFTTLRRLGIAPADPASDQEFLRRVTLDLTGRIPTAQDVAQFLADPRPEKRGEWIDRLLGSAEWADRWAMFFGDLYKNTTVTPQLNRYQQGRDRFHYYILDSLRANKSYKEMARELLTGSASNFEIGQVNFVLGGRTTGGPAQDTYDTQTVNAATAFLGMNHVDCILCHDGAGHLDSLSVWGAQAKRNDALAMAAFFARTDLVLTPGQGAQPWMVRDVADRNYLLNTTTGNRPTRRPINGKNFVMPVYMFGGGAPNPGENWRDALARLITGDFQFARATVNYIWREFMTVGLVDPPDQFDPLRLDPNKPPPAPWTLQPSNPALLDALAQNFIRSNYDLKALMRDISNSRAYQLSSRYNGAWDPAWERYYARKLVRRLTAEQIHDAVELSSGVLGGYVIAGFREPRIDFAMQLPDVVGIPGGAGSQFLDSFLRGNRYDDDRRSDSTISQALNLMNSPFVYNRTRNAAGTLLNRLITQPNDQLVDQLYLSVLSRYPAPDERQAAIDQLNSGTRANKAEDLFWSLYNKVDFVFTY